MNEKENYTKKGDKLVKKAFKKLEGGFFANLLSSKDERFDNALEYYEKAIT